MESTIHINILKHWRCFNPEKYQVFWDYCHKERLAFQIETDFYQSLCVPKSAVFNVRQATAERACILIGEKTTTA